jgi:Outer membrane lipoprotein-sorting protein
MRRSLTATVKLCVTLGLAASGLFAADSPAPLPDPDRDGAELARKLRDAAPEGESSFSGVLIITGKDDRVRTVPLQSTITISPTNWVVSYRAGATNGSTTESLTIGQPNQFNYRVGTATNASLSLTNTFAGSDFWLIDLGLDFLHWPKQRRLGHEMRSSRSCHVLESTRPDASDKTGYARVVSWVDIETGGLIRAEAYDSSGRLVKEFKVDRFRKVAGRYQLESMVIWSRLTGQETVLKFDLRANP